MNCSASRLSDRLDREWSQLRTRPAAIRHAAGWSIVEGSLHDLDQVLAAVGYLVTWTPRHEFALRQLVARAGDDELAARVVIQRILPGLAATARRRHRAEALDELVGAAWIAVRTFDPSRRTGCVAAALIGDADHVAFRRAWRRASAGEWPTGLAADELVADEPPEDPGQLLAVLVDRATAAGMPSSDIELIRMIIDETPTVELARALKVTPRTVRNRRERITERLRQVAA